MFDIRDHGGSYGGGKYDKGKKLYAKDTEEKNAFQTVLPYVTTSTNLEVFYEDETNVYCILSQSYISSFNKQTKVMKQSVSAYSGGVSSAFVCPKGFLYVFNNGYLIKFNRDTMVLIWSLNMGTPVSDKKKVVMHYENEHIHIMLSYNSQVYWNKATENGVHVKNLMIYAFDSLHFSLNDGVVSFLDNKSLRRFLITDGSFLSFESVGSSAFYSQTVDHKNVITYSRISGILKCSTIAGVLIWSRTVSDLGHRAYIAMRDGLYFGEYEGKDIKIGLDGSVIYSNQQIRPHLMSYMYHEYGKEVLYGTLTSGVGNSYYYNLGKISEYITIGR